MLELVFILVLAALGGLVGGLVFYAIARGIEVLMGIGGLYMDSRYGFGIAVLAVIVAIVSVLLVGGW